ncbi:hypothetical protein KAONASHI_00320 [Serratia phage vB_SmaP-Kaonashi]|nr:hypothetical protein KAONASHI_00320 [Serratia phage vB_SmaP-Kaonashi]
MTKYIVIDGNTSATTTATLGEDIAAGVLKQVGVIRTEYVVHQGDTQFVRGRSTEAVVVNEAGDFLAVEQHRGLAILAMVGDEEMIAAFKGIMDSETFEEGEVFVYDQRITEGSEMIADVKALDMSHIPVEDGTDGIA